MNKNLDAYIEKVVRDAHRAENRVVDFECEYCIHNGYLLFAMKCPFMRVRTRVAYRLYNNLPKQGLKFQLVLPWKEALYNSERVYDIGEILDPNYSVAIWKVFGKWYNVRGNYEEASLNPYFRKFDEQGSIYMRKLKEHGYDIDDPHTWSNPVTKECWESFSKAYEEICGKKQQVFTSHHLQFHEGKHKEAKS